MEKPGEGDLGRGGGETGRKEAEREGRERGKEREKEWENRKRERDRAGRGKEGRESMLVYVQVKAHQDRDPVTATPGVPNPHLLSTQTPRWLHAHHSRDFAGIFPTRKPNSKPVCWNFHRLMC